MRYLPIFISSLLAASARAQSNSDTPCCEVPSNEVSARERSNWCSFNTRTCMYLCDSLEVSTRRNVCNSDTLDYYCECPNGTDITASLSKYLYSVPGQMCQYWAETCVNATDASDTQGRLACNETRDAQCGTEVLDQGIAPPAVLSSLVATIPRSSSIVALSTAVALANASTANASPTDASTTDGSGATWIPPIVVTSNIIALPSPSASATPASGAAMNVIAMGSAGLWKGAIVGVVVGAAIVFLP